MTFTFTIPGHLTALNQYNKIQRANKYAGAKLKKEETNRVMLHILEKRSRPGFICPSFTFQYIRKDKRTDKDNVAFTKKFIFDGMVKAGLIPDDKWDNIAHWEEYFFVDKKNPRTIVELTEL